ncbi:MAG TPA: hypothetical protein VH299_00570 [Solirubrobacterales bacterium]|jgi:hypothetical protein|nr:hypothetical protein [Solirubrobacterales bacterium]
MNDDALEKAYQRLTEASARLDAAWPQRLQKPEVLRAAIDEVDAAGKDLLRAKPAPKADELS